MTVCVAAICDEEMVVGMSDRMLTAGDVQFQPSSSKIWPINSSIVMMSSGDIGLQTEIFSEILAATSAREKTNPGEWWRVADVAELYRLTYFSIRQRRAEKEILAPIGLDKDSFLVKQAAMEPSLVSDIAKELIGYRLPGVSAIIAGNNPSIRNPEEVSAHIYVIENGALSCSDKVGFACIGAGAWHANSTMMFAGHTPQTPPPKAILSVYAAKRRAEVAPGVGGETDTFVVTPTLGGYSELRDEILDAAKKAYENTRRQQLRSQQKAEEFLHGYIEEITQSKSAEPSDGPA